MAYKINEDLYIGNTNKQLKDLLVPVHDAYSTSTTDTYSCNYINNIVETGSNANGTYVKYSDGRMECYKRVIQKNVKLTGTWYGLYINENDTMLDLGNYAATFIEEPIVNITYMGGNGCWLINNNGHSASSPGKVQLCTVSSRTIGTCILDITAKGKWK